MHLILVRHAETIENHRGIIQGQRPGQISKVGKQQIKFVVKNLKNEKINALFSSDLQRCIDTAEPLHQIYKNVPFKLSPALREFSYGKLQGLSLGRLIKLVPKFGFVLHIKLPGGESYKQVESRIVIYLNKLYKLYPNNTVLLVSSGGPIRLMRILLDQGVKPYSRQNIDNCSIWRLEMSKPI